MSKTYKSQETKIYKSEITGGFISLKVEKDKLKNRIMDEEKDLPVEGSEIRSDEPLGDEEAPVEEPKTEPQEAV